MSDELDPNKQGAGTPADPIKKEDPKPSDEEVRKAQLQKDIADLEASKSAVEAAKLAAETELKRVREEKRNAKKNTAPVPDAEEEKVIDENDPDAKAWLKKINSTISPIAEEQEKEKAEIFSITLEEFLEDRPATAKSPEKLKEMMGLYDRIATSRTREGMRRDLDKAYAATFHKELLDAARQTRIQGARNDALFSDIAVSRGSTGYSAPNDPAPKITKEQEAILAKWGMTPDEWQKMAKAQQEKSQE